MRSLSLETVRNDRGELVRENIRVFIVLTFTKSWQTDTGKYFVARSSTCLLE
jgi:hypothetical protein